MNATIGVYDTQADALNAVKELKAAGFHEKNVSVIARQKVEKAELADGENGAGQGLDSDNTFDQPMKIAATGIGIGATVGPLLGALAGIGLLAVPGIGVIVGAGALAGAVAGLDVGLIGGGVFSALAIANLNKHHEALYHEHLQAGKVVVVVHGSHQEVSKAREVLHQFGKHLHLESHQS
ncbi:MAG: hypothetical protein JST36_05980 [Bacteroidetes bacterium]|nr:hypothetical protein [Bacteroidota bacterium]